MNVKLVLTAPNPTENFVETISNIDNPETLADKDFPQASLRLSVISLAARANITSRPYTLGILLIQGTVASAKRVWCSTISQAQATRR